MEVIGKLKKRTSKLKKQLTIVHYAYQDKRINIWVRIIIGIAILYSLSPIDLIPDFVPILGYLDDLIIVPALIGLAIRLIPDEVLKDARIKAEQRPVKLRKKWAFGIIFIAIWVFIIFSIVRTVKGIK